MSGPRRRRRGTCAASRRVEIRLTDDEHRAIAAAAARPGQGVSVSRFVAEAALRAAEALPRPPVKRRPPSSLALAEIAAATVAVNRIGNNLNQLAREMNATGRRPPGTFAEMERARAALDHLALVAAGASA